MAQASTEEIAYAEDDTLPWMADVSDNDRTDANNKKQPEEENEGQKKEDEKTNKKNTYVANQDGDKTPTPTEAKMKDDQTKTPDEVKKPKANTPGEEGSSSESESGWGLRISRKARWKGFTTEKRPKHS